MRHRIGLLAAALLAALPAAAGASVSADQVLDAIVANERAVAEGLQRYRPLVETYIQTVGPDPELGSRPIRDAYFFGRLELPEDAPRAKPAKKSAKKSLDLYGDFHSQTFKPESFVRMLTIDRGSFDREHYDFDFVRTEFLGEIRTLVFDVTPKDSSRNARLGSGRFVGRIFVDDREYNVVRYNGVYSSMTAGNPHFDSWRIQMPSGEWMPAYVYTEEADRTAKQLKLTHRGQTRLWGYRIVRPDADDAFTKVLIEAAETDDRTESAGQVSPVESMRAWQNEAEDNVVGRLSRAGLLAPEGEVDRVLETVVSNLEITNGLDLQPPVRCRVLLTTPLESFTIGRTIVVSRGLLDVLPDEASLAAVLAHELGHIVSGHELDTAFAFTDQILVADKQAMEHFLFERTPEEEAQADAKAIELLRSSPYKADLGKAGVFLKALAARAGELPSLVTPHFGNRLAVKDRLYRLEALAREAPELAPGSLQQIAALPLGGRIQLDPWEARVELMKSGGVALVSAREKMPFQVTPLMPYLARYSDGVLEVVASEEAKRPVSRRKE